jgi:hypothetical protein
MRKILNMSDYNNTGGHHLINMTSSEEGMVEHEESSEKFV